MSVLEAIILGLIQGIAEFLPISSSGHLALAQHLFGIKEASLSFNVLLHVGTLVPVCIIYWKELWKLIKKPFQKTTYLLIIGTIPAVISALLLGDVIESLFSSLLFLAAGFAITGGLLLFVDTVRPGTKEDRDMTYVDALVIGCAQGVAIAPAISRSGSTISASLLRGLNRETAARFSFLLSIPAILGAAVLQVKDVITGGEIMAGISPAAMIAGFLVAMISGYLAIQFMLALIQKAKLKVFSVYLFLLSAFILVDQLVLGGMFL